MASSPGRLHIERSMSVNGERVHLSKYCVEMLRAMMNGCCATMSVVTSVVGSRTVALLYCRGVTQQLCIPEQAEVPFHIWT